MFDVFAPLLSSQHFHDMAEFGFDFANGRDGMGNLGTEGISKPLAQALNRLLDGLFGQIESLRNLGIGLRVTFAPDEILELFKPSAASCSRVLFAQAMEGVFQNGERPTPFIKSFRRGQFDRFDAVAIFRVGAIERYRVRPAAALEAAAFRMFLGEEVFHGREQEGSEFASLRVCQRDGILFQQVREEGLREVLSILAVLSETAHVGVERIPVSAAEFFERFGGLRRSLVRGVEHDSPACCDKPRLPRAGTGLGLFGIFVWHEENLLRISANWHAGKRRRSCSWHERSLWEDVTTEAFDSSAALNRKRNQDSLLNMRKAKPKVPSVKLGKAHEQFITDLIERGRYTTRSAIVRAALRLLEEAEAARGEERRLRPFTKEEARRAFAPDREWDALEAHLAKHAVHRPPEPD